jgi:2-iminobutanoate/2-iminopropanoate deaminase
MKQTIKTDQAPAAVGPYSQAVAITCRELLFCAGQIALDPKTQQMVEGDIQVQTRRVLENVKALLQASGTRLEHVIKTTVYLTNISDFAAMNEIYKEFFPEDPPARSAVGVAELPLGARVEIEVIAHR